MAYIIQHRDGGRFLSLYGWGSKTSALRWSDERGAEGYNRDHGDAGVVVKADYDDTRRPDVATEYDPFGLGTSNLAGRSEG